jgi:hypothetical protein
MLRQMSRQILKEKCGWKGRKWRKICSTNAAERKERAGGTFHTSRVVVLVI